MTKDDINTIVNAIHIDVERVVRNLLLSKGVRVCITVPKGPSLVGLFVAVEEIPGRPDAVVITRKELSRILSADRCLGVLYEH